jgi:hypothetical protein
VPRFNRRFAVPPTDASPAWRPLPRGIRLEAVCCLKYRRVVAPDHTVRVGATILQLPAIRGQRGYAHRRVDVEVRLDGRLVVWDGSRELLVRDAPADPAQIRALAKARLDLGRTAPTAGSVQKPALSATEAFFRRAGAYRSRSSRLGLHRPNLTERGNLEELGAKGVDPRPPLPG